MEMPPMAVPASQNKTRPYMTRTAFCRRWCCDYARYTPEKVASICGCRPEEVVKVAELLCRNSASARPPSAMRWAGRSTAPALQIICVAALVQLLLGNMGRPGGGIIALRGHANVQGATDIPTIFGDLPNDLPAPHAVPAQATLQEYLRQLRRPVWRGDAQDGFGNWRQRGGVWAGLPHYFVSLLKACMATPPPPRTSSATS